MSGTPTSVIESDFGESEEILGGYDYNLLYPCVTLLCDDSSSSSTLSGENMLPTEESPLSNFSNKHLNSSQNDSLQNTEGRIFVSKKIFKPLSSEVMPNSASHSAISKQKMILGKTQMLGTRKIISASPIRNNSNENAKMKTPINNKQFSVAGNSVGKNKINPKSITKQNRERFLSQQNIQQKMYSACDKRTNENRKINLGQQRIIQNQKVYLPDISTDNIKGTHINNNISVSEEQDPLYIPPLQGNIKVSNSAVSFNEDEKQKLKVFSRNAKYVRVIGESSSSQPRKSLVCSDDKNRMKPPPIPPRQKMNEHSVVKNYALQNKVSKTKKKEKNILANFIPIRPKPNTSAKNSDAIYKRKELTFIEPTHSDYCRNLFIKTSAWEYLEPVFKGFNERESNISKSCLEYFSQLSRNLSNHEECFSTENDLYFTQKVELLDKEGRLDKVLYISAGATTSRKRKPKTSTYVQPPTKRCHIVLERNEIVEQKVEHYMIQKKLNSHLLHYLCPMKDDVKKPLIILNHVNFNVLKINETLCKHANIIYVKKESDEFPEKLYKNSFFVSQIENKVIKLLSEEALKTYLM